MVGKPVEVEFTVDSGQLFLLQLRHGRSVGSADLELAAESTVLAAGIPASPGIATGTVRVNVDHARGSAGKDQRTVLVREFTIPADVPAMLSAAAVITSQGGATSHAAVVCREAGIPCVVGCGSDALGLLGSEVTVDGGAGAILEVDPSGRKK
jgi:pyruvate,orthophosphate dikinase